MINFAPQAKKNDPVLHVASEPVDIVSLSAFPKCLISFEGGDGRALPPDVVSEGIPKHEQNRHEVALHDTAISANQASLVIGFRRNSLAACIVRKWLLRDVWLERHQQNGAGPQAPGLHPIQQRISVVHREGPQDSQTQIYEVQEF